MCDAHHPPSDCDDVEAVIDDHNNHHDDRDAMISSRVMPTTQPVTHHDDNKVDFNDIGKEGHLDRYVLSL